MKEKCSFSQSVKIIALYSVVFFFLCCTGIEPEFHNNREELISKSAEIAKHYVERINAAYPEQLQLSSALISDGALTEKQLYALFEKCATPGSSIVLAVLGGSISAGAGYNVGIENVYINRLSSFIRGLCPLSNVRVINGARGGTGSLLIGMCMAEIIASQPDLLTVEFSLNDYVEYNIEGSFSSAPYELLIRNALTTFNFIPAIYNIYFWGGHFTKASAQEDHHQITERYELTGISPRDAIFSYLKLNSPPYAERDDILAHDAHHPNTRVHNHVGDWITLHIAGKYAKWVEQQANNLLSYEESIYALPDPVNKDVGRFNLGRDRLDCRGSGTTFRIHKPVFDEAVQWREVELYLPNADRVHQHACIQAESADSVGYISVDTIEGEVIVGSCPGAKEIIDPTVQLYLISTEPDRECSENCSTLKSTKIPLALEPVFGSIGEALRVVPPLPSGRQLIQIVPTKMCDKLGRKSYSEESCSYGFHTIITI